MIYLSNFSTAGKDSRAISIAAITPKWYKGAVRKDLAPKLSMVTRFKKGEMTTAEYIGEYTEIVYRHDIDQLASELDNHILLCYCSKNEFCHRILLGAYLNIETGIEIEEIGGFGEKYSDLFKNKNRPMNLILSKEEKDKYNLHGKFEHDNIIGHWKELKNIGATELFINSEM